MQKYLFFANILKYLQKNFAFELFHRSSLKIEHKVFINYKRLIIKYLFYQISLNFTDDYHIMLILYNFFYKILIYFQNFIIFVKNKKMNFLAHIYLSGKDEDVIVGNFFGDWVKGKEENWNPKYSENIRKGIVIHRFIDNFTGTHDIVRSSASKFSEKYRHYSKVVTDIIYDHFLAFNWHKFSDIELEKYTYDFYRLLIKRFWILPLQVKIFLPYMISNNRLLTYKSIKGVEKTLNIMSKNTSLPNYTEFAIDVLNSNYESLQNEAIEFLKIIIDKIKTNFDVNFN